MSEIAPPHSIGNFSGTFDGNNKRIKNGKGQIFFDLSGTIENLGVVNWANLKISSASLLTLTSTNTSMIRSTFVTGSLRAKGSNNDGVGGIVGRGGGPVEDSFSALNITSAPTLMFARNVGGICGDNQGNIRRSFSAGDVYGDFDPSYYFGGISGQNNGAMGAGGLENSFTVSRVTGNDISNATSSVGSSNNGPSPLLNNHFRSTADCLNVGTGTCLPWGTEQNAPGYFFNSANAPMDTWDFTNVWQEPDTVSGLPHLRGLGLPMSAYCWENMRFRNEPYANSGEGGIDGLSEANAFTICTAKQLEALGPRTADYGKYFKLEDDINLGHLELEQFTTIGSVANPFTGQFDGQFHKIYYFNVSTSNIHKGLFGYVGAGALIKSLGLIGVDITGYQSLGPLVGTLEGTVEKVFVTGSVKGNGVLSDFYAGGIVGKIENSGILQDCYANVTMDFSATGRFTGGLTGRNRGIIRRCYSTGSINGKQSVGGISGEADTSGGPTSTIDSFTLMNIAGNDAGAEVSLTFGMIDFTATISGVFYDSSISCTNPSGGCGAQDSNAGITGVDLSQNPDYFFKSTNPPLSNWDFTTVWQENDGALPTLRGF